MCQAVGRLEARSQPSAAAEPMQLPAETVMRDGAVLPALQKVVAEGVHPVAMSNTRITDEWASRDGKVEVKSHVQRVGYKQSKGECAIASLQPKARSKD